MKKIILTLSILVTTLMLFVGCEQIKQIISDTAAPQIENKVNEMLDLNDQDKKFKLPEAKRYEGFSVETTEEKDSYKIDVIEPKVTFEEYAVELNETFDGKFTKAEIKAGLAQENWVYRDGTEEYNVYFKEIKDANGNIEKWEIEVEIIHNNN